MLEGQNEGCQETEGDPVIVAYDFVTMYPSLEAKAAAKDAHDSVMVSPLEFSNVNYKEAVKYIASNMSEVEVENSDLRRVLPRRQNRKSTRPASRGQEALGLKGQTPHSRHQHLGGGWKGFKHFL